MDSVCEGTILYRSPKSLKVRGSCDDYIIITSYGYLQPIDSPAYESDIKVDDVIMEVEGTDVTRANGELVNSIIK